MMLVARSAVRELDMSVDDAEVHYFDGRGGPCRQARPTFYSYLVES